MAYEIKWTIRGKESYDDIMDYLEKEWTEREIRRFVSKTHQKLNIIAINPLLFPVIKKRKKYIRH